ncbi:MAG: hypothetical protein WCK86_10395 [Planctomycetia bacterium]
MGGIFRSDPQIFGLSAPGTLLPGQTAANGKKDNIFFSPILIDHRRPKNNVESRVATTNVFSVLCRVVRG